jgi:hypothetical protein
MLPLALKKNVSCFHVKTLRNEITNIAHLLKQEEEFGMVLVKCCLHEAPKL